MDSLCHSQTPFLLQHLLLPIHSDLAQPPVYERSRDALHGQVSREEAQAVVSKLDGRVSGMQMAETGVVEPGEQSEVDA